MTLSQAVVKFKDGSDFKKAVNELESRLRVQRNKQARSGTLGLMGIERSHQTGLPVTDIVKGEHLDAATYAKRNAADDEQRTTLAICQKAFDIPCGAGDICLNIEEMTDKNDWIAVIHADGNGLGQVVQKIGGDKDSFREFSKKLDAATTAAAVNAFETIKGKYEWRLRIPIRPIVLGGDLGW